MRLNDLILHDNSTVTMPVIVLMVVGVVMVGLVPMVVILVQSLTKSLERQLRFPAKKPTGGVRLVPTAQAAPRTSPENRTVVKKLQ
eukprot:g26426.t1